MTAIATSRGLDQETWTYKEMLLDAGEHAYQGTQAFIDTATGGIKAGQAVTSATLVRIGTFAETVDNSAGMTQVLVTINFPKEIVVQWWANALAGDAVAASDVGSNCLCLDNQTVTITQTSPATLSVAGRVMAVSATRGVAVEVR